MTGETNTDDETGELEALEERLQTVEARTKENRERVAWLEGTFEQFEKRFESLYKRVQTLLRG